MRKCVGVCTEADMDVLNVDEESAIMLACETMNLKGALRLAAYGADIRHVEKVRGVIRS